MTEPFTEEARPFTCGNCGAKFTSKAAKRRHKAECAPDAAEFEHGEDAPCDHADLYGRKHITPAIKARAAAEWAASDWRGRLPDGWTWNGETL